MKKVTNLSIALKLKQGRTHKSSNAQGAPYRRDEHCTSYPSQPMTTGPAVKPQGYGVDTGWHCH